MSLKFTVRVAALVALAFSPAAWAMQDASASAPPAATPASPRLHLAAGTVLTVEMTGALSSRTNHLGDTFAFKLVEPIRDGGVIVVPAGAAGQGEVIDAGPAGIYGKQGKLNISARFIDLNGQRVRIRGLTLGRPGEGRVGATTAMQIYPNLAVSLASIFVQGGNVEVPAGTLGQVKLSEDVDIPLPTAPARPPQPSAGTAP